MKVEPWDNSAISKSLILNLFSSDYVQVSYVASIEEKSNLIGQHGSSFPACCINPEKYWKDIDLINSNTMLRSFTH